MTELRPLTDHYCPTDAEHDESDGSHEECLLVRADWVRQANSAIYQIMLTRLNYDQRTRDYFARRSAEGKTGGEICRMLRRYIARKIYKQARTGVNQGSRGQACGRSWRSEAAYSSPRSCLNRASRSG